MFFLHKNWYHRKSLRPKVWWFYSYLCEDGRLESENHQTLGLIDALWYQPFDKVYSKFVPQNLSLLESLWVCACNCCSLIIILMAIFLAKTQYTRLRSNFRSVNDLLCVTRYVYSLIYLKIAPHVFYCCFLNSFQQYDWHVHKTLGETRRIKLRNKFHSEIFGHQSIFTFLVV